VVEHSSLDAAVIEIGPHAGWRFWLGIVLTGIGTGTSAAALTLILQAVQHFVWPGAGATLLDAAEQATPWRHILALLGATSIGQVSGVNIANEAMLYLRLPALLA
jgi:hypothetical protein